MPPSVCIKDGGCPWQRMTVSSDTVNRGSLARARLRKSTKQMGLVGTLRITADSLLGVIIITQITLPLPAHNPPSFRGARQRSRTKCTTRLRHTLPDGHSTRLQLTLPAIGMNRYITLASLGHNAALVCVSEDGSVRVTQSKSIHPV